MPLYEYTCGCTEKRVERLTSLSDRDKAQICTCGSELTKVPSIPCSAVITPTGRGMALDTLNDKRNGMPNRHWKPMAEKLAFAGI